MPTPGTGGPGDGEDRRHGAPETGAGGGPLTLFLRESDLARLRALAEGAYPGEACGLLAGWAGAAGVTVGGVVESPNLADGSDRFEVDPGVRARLQRTLRQAGDGRAVVGHFHSHPTGSAAPSAVDAARAGDEPHLVWVIVPVTPAGAGPPEAWRFDPREGTFRRLAIKTPGSSQFP